MSGARGGADGSAGAATPVLDDVESRPGSATSLLRTIVGAYLRPIGGAIAAADLVALLGDVGVPPSSARGTISRVKARGLLVSATVGGRPGYRLAPGAVAMLERGDRRIFSYRPQGESDPWCLVSYSVPETQRDARHQLRRHLAGIGCGRVATGLWICPAHLAGEVEQILHVLGLRDAATVFVTGTPRTPGTFADAAARWWDLGAVADLHHEFLRKHAPAPDDEGRASAPPSPREAYARWTRVLDDWRPVPYLDPGLPPTALPRDWPGRRAVETFERLRAALAGPAQAHAAAVARL